LQSKVVQRFLGTPKALIGLRQPNLAEILTVESDETGILFVVEEHVEGEPLSRMLARCGQHMALADALEVMTQVAEAMAVIHARGVAHGRLDPQHVLLAKQGATWTVKVVHVLGDEEQKDRGEDLARRAPELRSGNLAGDPRSDVWAIGALLYQALSGQAPSASERAATRTPLAKRAPQVPSELSQLVERCLADEPVKRPAHAREVRDVLCAIRESERARTRCAPDPLAAEAAAQRLKLALSATIAVPLQAPVPVPIQTQVAQSQAVSMASLPTASDAPQPPASAHDDEPEIVIQRVPKDLARRLAQAAIRQSGPPPSLRPVEIKTMRDLAAAFGPIEGADRIGQAEVDGAARARAFRRSIEGEQANAKGAWRRPAAAGSGASSTQLATDSRPRAPAGSPKQLRGANLGASRALSPEQLSALREGRQRSERFRDRIIGEFLLFAFVFALLVAIPLLWDPTRSKAQALLGARSKPVLGALAALSVLALLRTWSTQLQVRSFMLRPVTISLQVVTASVCVLCATYFLPDGALGPAEHAARYVLPWASGAFYLFLGLYGILQAARQGAGNALRGVMLAVLYSSGFFASYHAISSTVLAEAQQRARKHKSAQLKELGRSVQQSAR
jgi:hypothetical protein